MCLAATAGLTGSEQQMPPATVAFEVASVKPAADPGRVPIFCVVPCIPGEQLTVDHSRVTARYMSLERLILTAYGIKKHQFSGPEWADSQRFDIEARMPDGATGRQLPEMLKAMLAERFKLSVHRGSKELPVYALVAAKGGVKLQEAEPAANSPKPELPGSRPLYTPDGEARMTAQGRPEITSGPYGPIRVDPVGGESSRMEFEAITMAGLAEVIAPHQDRPVIDMTGIPGRYRFAITMDHSSG